MERQEEVLKTGWMVKSPPLTTYRSVFQAWQMRFFCFVQVKHNHHPDGEEFKLFLRYYKSDGDLKDAKLPLGQIDLDNCIGIEPCIESVGEMHYVINVYCKDRVFFLCTRTENQRLQWLRILRYHRFGEMPERYAINGKEILTSQSKKVRRASAMLFSSRIKAMIDTWPKEAYERSRSESISKANRRSLLSASSSTISDCCSTSSKEDKDIEEGSMSSYSSQKDLQFGNNYNTHMYKNLEDFRLLQDSLTAGTIKVNNVYCESSDYLLNDSELSNTTSKEQECDWSDEEFEDMSFGEESRRLKAQNSPNDFVLMALEEEDTWL